MVHRTVGKNAQTNPSLNFIPEMEKKKAKNTQTNPSLSQKRRRRKLRTPGCKVQLVKDPQLFPSSALLLIRSPLPSLRTLLKVNTNLTVKLSYFSLGVMCQEAI